MATKSVNDQPATLESVAAFSFEAAIDDNQVKEMEKQAQNKNHGITRRVALIALSRSKMQLIAGFGKDDETRELLGDTIENIEHYIAHLKGVVEVMEAAQARLFCVAGTIATNDDPMTPAGA